MIPSFQTTLYDVNKVLTKNRKMYKFRLSYRSDLWLT